MFISDLMTFFSSQVGPLFACIIGKQFKKLRDGDRFFFTHHRDASTLARGLKSRARSIGLGRSLGRILCDNLEDSILAKKVVGKGKEAGPRLEPAGP